jgi:type II secretory pathway pseudopilin PulG
VDGEGASAMNARGFSLLELLIATAIVIAIAGAVLAGVAPVQEVLRRWHGSVDVEMAARAALNHLTADVREAGSGPAIMPLNANFLAHVPPLALLEDIDSASPASPGAAIRITRIPYLAAQAQLSANAAVGAALLHLETTSRCSSGPPACGFIKDDDAVLFTQASVQRVGIVGAGPQFVQLTAPLTSAFAAGTAIAELVTTTYGLRDVGPGLYRLVRLTSGGAEQPLLDNVVTFQVTADEDDLADARRVSVLLRVRAGHEHVPDVELRTDIALRNIGGLP